MKNPIKIAVYGTGSIGMRHLEVLKSMEGIEPIAISKRPGRFKNLEDMGYKTAPDLESAARLGVELCIVATDTACHLQDGLCALELGMDVLMEKPLAKNSLEGADLLKASKKMKKKIFVGCVLRQAQALNIFCEKLPQVGKIHSVHIECQSYLPDWRKDHPYRDSYSARKEEGGVLRDLIHEIDYAGSIFGWPEKLEGHLANLGVLGIEAEERADLRWETKEGVSVLICLDYLTRVPRRKMRACGEKGTITWDGIQKTVLLTIIHQDPQLFEAPEENNALYAKQAMAFMEACLQGSATKLADGEEGFKALAICDAARLSSQSQKTEVVHYKN
ncbi:MAG: Gfo/Idh/MocA family oxidoreductase [Deltaproteobacteria bacterium]|nr:Gfo/Idh/MocA family oxidoreductase [Deltaproteobacteria bacterium]